MLPTIHLGPLSIQTPGLLLLCGLIAFYTSLKWNKSTIVDQRAVENIVFYSLISGLIGARLFYVINHLEYFFSTPLNAFIPSITMLDISGGWLTGGLTVLVMFKRKRLPFWETLDSIVPGLIIMWGVLALAHLASGDFYGRPTNAQWGVWLLERYRQPTQVYEFVGTCLTACFLYVINRTETGDKINRLVPGTSFLIFTSILSFIYVVVCGLTDKNVSYFFIGINAVQLIAWIFLSFSLWRLGLNLKQATIKLDIS